MNFQSAPGSDRIVLGEMASGTQEDQRHQEARLTRSERRSWELHSALARALDKEQLERWRPRIEENLRRLRQGVRGQPHLRNLERWEELLRSGDIAGLREAMRGLDLRATEMREVSPLGGLLPEHERRRIPEQAR